MEHWDSCEILESSNENVLKYVFKKEDAIAEAVLYKYPTYEDRTVMCISVMSGCPVGCSFCLPLDSRVLMADFTYKNIQDIKIGDKVIGNELTKASNIKTSYASKYYKEATVLEVMSSEIDTNLIEITTQSGKIITMTENHELPVKKVSRNKYIPSSEVKVGDSIITNDPFKEDLSIDWKKGWLVGFTQGDGVLCKRARLNHETWSVSQSNDLIYTAQDYCNLFDIKTSEIWSQDNKNPRHKISYRFELNKDNTIKMNRLINEVHASNNIEMEKGFLAGFWDAEGFSFRNNKTVRVCNNDEAPLNKFDAYISKYKVKSRYDRTNKCIRLDCGMSRLLFIQLFKPLNTKKDYLSRGYRIKNLSQFEEVISVAKKPFKGTVYNIRTSEDTYIANNVTVHNCGTGKFFIRNLTSDEIEEQVYEMLASKDLDPTTIKNWQIQCMSMGEPILTQNHLILAFNNINKSYPHAQLLVSTAGPDVSYEPFMLFSETCDKTGLQFSAHESTDENRDKLVPFKNKLTLKGMADKGEEFYLRTGRHPFFNYCVHEDNNSVKDVKRLKAIFDPRVFKSTVSVICEKDETVPVALERQRDLAESFDLLMQIAGYDTRVFDPAGQEEIGGGCGMLWQVQRWAEENKDKVKKSVGYYHARKMESNKEL